MSEESSPDEEDNVSLHGDLTVRGITLCEVT